MGNGKRHRGKGVLAIKCSFLKPFLLVDILFILVLRITYGQVITLAVHDGLEGSDGILELDQDTVDTGEDLSDCEGL